MFDLEPPARELNRLLAGVRDDQLSDATPCEDWSVADLLAHVHQFATVFTGNALKQTDGIPPAELPGDWRTAVPRQVDALVAAWSEESAWTGRVSAGGIEMDAEDNAVVAFEELVLHGWDLARATGQEVRVEDPWLDQLDRFNEVFAAALESGQGPYGPTVSAPDDATRLERSLAQAGREPRWSPSAP